MLGRATLKHILSGLAPSGVYRDRRCHQRRGELLPHLFTLTSVTGGGYFLWHCPAGHPGWSLATTLPCGARTFLGTGFPATRPPGQLIRGSRVPLSLEMRARLYFGSMTSPATAGAPPQVKPRPVHPVAAVSFGVLCAFMGMLPWIVTGMRLPLQNLWESETLPESMPRALIPLSNYSVVVTSAILVIGAALGGLAVVIARTRGRAMSAGYVLAGVLGVQIGALAHAAWALDIGLESSSRASLYVSALVGGAAVTILVGIPILLGIARGHAAPATLAVAASSVALSTWLTASLFAIVPISAQVPLVVWRTIEWLPLVIAGIAIGWCGWRTAQRATASVFALVIIWVLPALATAVSYGIGSRIYLQYPAELFPASKQVFVMALGTAGQGPQRIAITVVVAILAWVFFRTRRTSREPQGDVPQLSPASNP